jgi:hypothetical protein
MPDGWAPSAGGFPAMTEHVAFLMKDLVLLAASFYLPRQDAVMVAHAAEDHGPVVGPNQPIPAAR